MPILIEWDNEPQHIILASYSGRWTWDEFFSADSSMRQMIDQANGQTHLIIDVTKNIWFPPDIAEHSDRIVSALDPRLGMIVLVGREINKELMNLIATANDIITSRYSFAYDLETAERIIDEWTKRPQKE
jgi:hypothetical protein